MTTAKTMAEVLAEHEMDFTYDGKQTGCSCGHWQARGPVSAHADHAAHQSAALSAAGFGLVADAKAEAWDEAALALMDVNEHESRMPGIRFAVGFLAGQKRAAS